MNYEFHPAAGLFPMMGEEALKELGEDIKANGLRETIKLLGGVVLDGRNRLRACEGVGVEPRFEKLGVGEVPSPVGYVISLNLKRRHLTPGQCACVAVEAEPMFVAEGAARMLAGKKADPSLKLGKGRSSEAAGKLLGVSHGYVEVAKSIKSKSPGLFVQVRSGEKSITQAERELKEQWREKKRDENRVKVAAAKLPEKIEGVFSTIVIDPPWDWGDEGDVNQLGRAKPDYAAMSFDELMKLPVGKLSAEDCHLYCWITNRSLPKGFALLEKWGFRYITALTWPKPSFGMGNYFRGQTEHVLFGVKGSQGLKRKDASTLLPGWKRGKGHSVKPKEFREFVESCSPGPYLQMFSRSEPRKDWTEWGEGS